MNNRKLLTVVAALATASLLAPADAQAARQGLNINFSETADQCGAVAVRAGGSVARAEERFTVTKSEAPVLEVEGASRANIRVRGWDRPDYSVEVCRIAAAEDQASADQLLQAVSVTRAGARFSAAGPSGNGSRWLVVFIVHAPSGASLDLKTANGPIDARDVNGVLKIQAANGPISIRDCQGTLDAQVTNGPISFSGSTGDVRLVSTNGPIALTLSAEVWSGPKLEARTSNGPVSLKMPNTFRSAVRVESARHSPVGCRIEACNTARSESTENGRVLELNGNAATVRLSTERGPISVSASGARGRYI